MTGSENHDITLTEAAKLTRNYRTAPVTTVVSAISGMKAQAFSKEALQQILDQSGCTGIRFYFGVDTAPPIFNLIGVGVDSGGDDIISGHIIQHSFKCPPHCSADNVLNS